MNFFQKLKNYLNIIAFCSFSILMGCKTITIETATAPSKYGEIDILSIEKNKTEKVVLFIPDDDTVSIEEQVSFFLPLLEKRSSLYAFPKYHHANLIEKDNADNPRFRLELLVAAYQDLVAKGNINESQEVLVLGLGEGSLIAPQFARLVNASKLYLLNPLYHSYKENFTIAYTENTKNATDLKTYLGFAYPNQWLEFFEYVEKGTHPDNSAGRRTYRYYNSYWDYYPGNFIGTQLTTEIVIFKDFYLSSEYDKNFMLNHKQPNISAQQMEGYMFSKFSGSEIKKLHWF